MTQICPSFFIKIFDQTHQLHKTPIEIYEILKKIQFWKFCSLKNNYLVTQKGKMYILTFRTPINLKVGDGTCILIIPHVSAHFNPESIH